MNVRYVHTAIQKTQEWEGGFYLFLWIYILLCPARWAQSSLHLIDTIGLEQCVNQINIHLKLFNNWQIIDGSL